MTLAHDVAGHLPNLERPTETAALIKDFLYTES